jgi:hypothetical protein
MRECFLEPSREVGRIDSGMMTIKLLMMNHLSACFGESLVFLAAIKD